jgi:hypothetical protein
MDASVRALHLQTLINAFDALGPERAEAARAALHPTSRRRIRDAARLDWIPAEVLVEICEAVRAVGGDDQLEPWGAAALRGAFATPLTGAFWQAALALGRRDPGVIVRQLSHVWPLLYHHCGDVVVTHTGPDHFRLVHADVPPLLRRKANVMPLLGALASLPETCDAAGRGEVEWSTESARCVFTVRWSRDVAVPA